MKTAPSAAISAILGIICQLVRPETKEYEGVPSLVYAPDSNMEGSVGLDVVVAHWYMRRSCLMCVMNDYDVPHT